MRNLLLLVEGVLADAVDDDTEDGPAGPFSGRQRLAQGAGVQERGPHHDI